MNIEREREAFEAIPENIRLLRGAKFSDGKYVAISLFDDSSKECATQLNYGWSMWKSSALRAAEKLEGCVVVPVEPTEEMYQAYAKHSVAPMSTLSKTGYKAMVEAARGGK